MDQRNIDGTPTEHRRNTDGTSTGHRRNNDGTTTEQKLNTNGQMGLCIEGEGQGRPGTRRGPGGAGGLRAQGGGAGGPAHQGTAGPKPGRGQTHTFGINCKTRDLNVRPFRPQSKTLTARPQTVA